MASDRGEFYEPPEWYGLISASRFLGVAPWELAEQPIVWRDWALIAKSGEENAERMKQRMREQMRATRTMMG